LSGKKEQERILLDTPHFLLNIDTKWRSHPDPKTTPRAQWYQHPSTADLYCLIIFKDERIASIRDLRGPDHLPILYAMLDECAPVLERIYGVSRNQLRWYFHYPPQFYHAHVHVNRLNQEWGAPVERAHLLQDVIQNLEMDPNYYVKRTLTYKLSIADPLYKRMQEAEK